MIINPLASPSAGAPALKYGDVNTVTPSPGEVKGLTNLNLSNFNTQNVTNMSGMFECCTSLTNLNISNFNTQNVTDMRVMFSGCNSLNKNNLITKDKKVLNQFLKK